MELARVVGTVVSSVKYEGLEGVKLLLVQPQEADGKEVGEPLVVADAMQAGLNDVVAWVGGREATLALPVPFVPVDAAVVAIVDHAWKEEKYL